MIGHTRWRFRSVPSTQDVAFQLAGMGTDSGTVVRADYQSSGRGRLGRSWEAPANTALTFSVLLRTTAPLHQLGTLSIQTAAALGDVLAAAGADNIAIKWPNDVLLGGRKVSGILVQTRPMPDPVAVIGIGVNLSTPLDSLPPTATSLSHEISAPIDPDVFFEQLIHALNRMWITRQPTLTQSQVDELDRQLWLRNEHVTLLDADREIAGTLMGIAPDGSLRLEIDGTEQTIHAGEIIRGPRPSRPHRQS